MNYKVGDEVVCLSAKPMPHKRQSDTSDPTGLVAGKIYLVLHATGDCVAVQGGEKCEFSECPDCLASDTDVHYCAWRFIKLDGLTETERTEIKETA